MLLQTRFANCKLYFAVSDCLVIFAVSFVLTYFPVRGEYYAWCLISCVLVCVLGVGLVCLRACLQKKWGENIRIKLFFVWFCVHTEYLFSSHKAKAVCLCVCICVFMCYRSCWSNQIDAERSGQGMERDSCHHGDMDGRHCEGQLCELLGI